MSDWNKGKYYFSTIGLTSLNNSYSRKVYNSSKNYGENVWASGVSTTINLGAGGDAVELAPGAAKNVVHLGAGDDYLTTEYGGEGSTIYGEKGNDTIRTERNNIYADGGDGDDLFIPLYNGNKASTGITLLGGNGDDTFWFIDATKATITGGAGKDTYLFDPYKLDDKTHYNELVITDFSVEDVIVNDGEGSNGEELKWYKDNKGNIVLEDTDYRNFKITFQGITDIKQIQNAVYDSRNGSATFKEIFKLEDDGGEDNALTFNSANTAVTISADYEYEDFDAADYAKLKTINASAATADLIISGNKLANSITGGNGNDCINGGSGTDTYTGGKGNDIFVYESGLGNKVITDYTEGEDKIEIQGADVETVIKSAQVKSGNVIFTVGKGKITVKGGDGQKITFTDDGGEEYTYPDIKNDIIFNSAKTAATITSNYKDEAFDAADYAKLKTINAADVTADLTIIGNKNANVIIGGEGNDCINGGSGTDTYTGGEGEDIFVYESGSGNKIITDYTEGEDKIEIQGADVKTVINSAQVKSGNVIFTVGKGKITVKGGDGKEITFTDEDGEEYTYPEPTTETVIFNSANTAATITADYEDEEFDAADYAKLKTIDASEATKDLTIFGNKLANVIIGGEGNDCINGGLGADTYTGGDGEDIFVYKSGTGNKIITDYTEGEDKIEIQGADVKTVIKSAQVKSGNVIFTVGKGKITVKGGDGKEITFTDEDGDEYTYPESPTETVIFNSANTAATITAEYDDTEFNAADYAKLKTIDASAVTADLTIFGNKLANVIIGGEGNDCISGGKGTDTYTGGEGEDIFVYESGSGNKTITDYTEGEDKIEIQGADVKTVIKSAQVKSGNVIFTVGKGKITVKGGDGKEITFTDEDGTEYTYPESTTETVIFNSANTAATITAEYDDTEFNAADYAKLKTIDASAVTADLTIFGNKLANVIIGGEGNDCINGGKGTDTYTGGEGEDIFVYESGSGNKTITDYTEGEDKIEIQGANVETVIKSAQVKSGNVIFTVGKGKITVKGGDGQEITFIDKDGDEYSYAQTNARTIDLFEDNNFISDDAQLDSITEITADNYSVEKIETVSAASLTQDDKIFIACVEK